MRELRVAAVVLAVLAGGCAGEEEGAGDAGADVVADVVVADVRVADVVGFPDFGPIPELPSVDECETGADCVEIYGDAGSCEAWACNKGNGECIKVIGQGGALCDDDNVCTLESKCSGGLCLKAGPLLDCGDGNPCTSDSCEPAAGCTHSPIAGGICNDGDPCTSGESCQAGVCGGGAYICPAKCGDGLCHSEKGETCGSCPLDCGPCPTGCAATGLGGCGGCACENCVCTKMPECCTTEWTEDCAAECTGSCGQTCDGCEASPLPTCGGCACEACVCDLVPSCCTTAWTSLCTSACKDQCGGCP